MKCPKCGEVYRDMYSMCPYCHTKKPKPHICPKCGYESYEDYFCPKCHIKLLTEYQIKRRKQEEKLREEKERKEIQTKIKNYRNIGLMMRTERRRINEYDSIKNVELPKSKLLLELSRKPNFKNKGLIERKIKKGEIKTLNQLDKNINN